MMNLFLPLLLPHLQSSDSEQFMLGWAFAIILLVVTALVATFLLSKQEKRVKQVTEVAARQAVEEARESAIKEVTEIYQRSVPPAQAIQPPVVPKTELFPDESSSASQRPPAQLVSYDTAQDIPEKIKLHTDQISIGRERTFSDVVIPSRFISRIHARIQYRDDSYYLLDEGSTSGTHVNKEKVGNEGHALQDGDIIRMGPIRYQFEIMSEATPKEHTA